MKTNKIYKLALFFSNVLCLKNGIYYISLHLNEN